MGHLITNIPQSMRLLIIMQNLGNVMLVVLLRVVLLTVLLAVMLIMVVATRGEVKP